MAGKVIEIPAGGAKNIDLSQYTGEIVEGSGATATASRLADLDSTESVGAIAVSNATALPNWPFIRVSSAGGITYVGLVRR